MFYPKASFFLFFVFILFQVSIAQRGQNRKFPSHILRKINAENFLNSEAWKRISNRHGLKRITWNTTLPSSEQVRETAVVSEDKNVIYMTSRDNILKETGYDNYVTMMDFETGLVAFRVRLPNKGQFAKKRRNGKFQRKRGPMSRRNRNMQGRRFKLSERNQNTRRRNGGMRRRNSNGRGRRRNNSRRNNKMNRSGKFRKALHQRFNRMRKFFGGRFQACFVGQMDTTLTDVQEELNRRENATKVLVGIPKKFVAEQKNRILDDELSILSPKIARFCRRTSNVFRLVSESTVNTDIDTIQILGQFDATQVSTSVPYEIHLESTIVQSKSTTVQPEMIVSTVMSSTTLEPVPATTFPLPS